MLTQREILIKYAWILYAYYYKQKKWYFHKDSTAYLESEWFAIENPIPLTLQARRAMDEPMPLIELQSGMKNLAQSPQYKGRTF